MTLNNPYVIWILYQNMRYIIARSISYFTFKYLPVLKYLMILIDSIQKVLLEWLHKYITSDFDLLSLLVVLSYFTWGWYGSGYRQSNYIDLNNTMMQSGLILRGYVWLDRWGNLILPLPQGFLILSRDKERKLHLVCSKVH